MHRVVFLTLILTLLASCNFTVTGFSFETLRESADRVDIDVTYTVEQDEPDSEMRPRKGLVGIEYRVVATAFGVPPADSAPVNSSCMGALVDPGATSRPTLRKLVLSTSTSSLTLREDVRINSIPASCAAPPLFDLVICTSGCTVETPVNLYMRVVVDDCSAALGDTLLATCAAEIEKTSWALVGLTSTDPAI